MTVLRNFLKTFEDIIYLERFTSLDGLLQRIDSRVKLCCIVASILSAIAVRTLIPLLILLALAITLSLLSKIPLKSFLLRTIFFIPIFAGIIALPLPFITPGTSLITIRYNHILAGVTAEGIYRATQFTLRVLTCVALLILLVFTTRSSRLFHSMEYFKIPRLFTAMTAITYRFVFMLINEAYRMLLAKESRTVTQERWREALRSFGNMLSSLFIRAYERGEKVYLAMLARGYDGTVRSVEQEKITPKDLLFAGTSLTVCLLALSLDYLVG